MGSCCEWLGLWCTLIRRAIPKGCRMCVKMGFVLGLMVSIAILVVAIVSYVHLTARDDKFIAIIFVCIPICFACLFLCCLSVMHVRHYPVPLNTALPMEGFITEGQPDRPVRYMRRPAEHIYAPKQYPKDPFRKLRSQSQDFIKLHSDDQLTHQQPYVQPSPLVLNTSKEYTHHAVENLLEELGRRREIIIGETSGGGPSTSVDESERTSAGNITPLDKDEGEKQYGPETLTEARGKTSLSSKYGQPKKSKKTGVPGGPEGAREKDLEAGGASHSGARPQETSFTTKTGPFSKSVVKSPSERQGVHLVEEHETQPAPLAVEESAAVQSSSAEDSDSSAAGKPIVSLQSKEGESRILYAKKKSEQSKESVEDETEEKR